MLLRQINVTPANQAQVKPASGDQSQEARSKSPNTVINSKLSLYLTSLELQEIVNYPNVCVKCA